MNLTLIWQPWNIFLLFSLESNNLTNYRGGHFKLFTNCHVSWDTLYLKPANIWCIYSKQILKIKRNTSRLQILYKNYVNNEENGHFNSLRLFCYKYLRFLTTHHSSNFHFFQTNVVGLGYLKSWSINQRFKPSGSGAYTWICPGGSSAPTAALCTLLIRL